MVSVVHQDEEELLEEHDVQSLINNVNKEAEDVQQILRNYIGKTKGLESLVVAFEQRDISEEKELLRISSDIALSEINACKNMRYVEFAHQHNQFKKLPNYIGERNGGDAKDLRKVERKSWFAQLTHGAPDAGFSLCDYGNVVEVLLGWRPLTQTLRLQLTLLQGDIDGSVSNLSSCVLMINGLLCTPCDLLEFYGLTQSELDDIIKFDNHCNALGDIYLRWNNVVLKRSRLTDELFHRNWNCLLDSSELKSELAGDGNDFLTVVSYSRLENSAIFRGFFFSQELRGIESIGAQVNVLSSLLKSCSGKSQECLETCLVQLFNSFYCQETRLLSQYKNAVVILAVRDQDAYRGEGTRWNNYVVLDIRPLAPTIPFKWRFTWTDICALGQISSDNNLWHTLPILKLTRVEVSTLTPYDPISRTLFPFINKCLHKENQRIGDGGANKFSKLAAAAVVLVTAGVLVGAVLKRHYVNH